MKRLTILLPLTVLAALVFGFVRARLAAAERSLPAFAPTWPQQFAELSAPLGVRELRGHVVDIDGVPVADVDLYLRSNDVPFWTTSDAGGAFAFEGLGDAEVEIAALVWGRPPRLHRALPGATDFQLVLAQPHTPPQSLPTLAYAPLSGRIAHPLGSVGIDSAGYEVAFLPRTSPAEFGAAVERRVRCDARGFFFVEDLARGAYSVVVVPNWAAGTDFPDPAAPEDAQLDHVEGALEDIAVGLQCGVLEGTLLEAGGAPLHGALILVAESGDAARIWPPQTSDGLGRFRFVDLPLGTYRLTIRAGEGALETLVEIRQAQVTRPEFAPLVVRRR
jgi:hypothetical protein